MAAGTYDIVIDQGSDFAIEIAVSPSPTSGTKTADFVCAITNASQGKIKMSLTNTTTAAISSGKYYYDLELVNTSTSVVNRLLQGVARVTPEVTR